MRGETTPPDIVPVPGLTEGARAGDLCTVVNCSVGLPLGEVNLDRATALGVDRIELWWPWATPEPTDTQVEDLVEELTRRGLTLVAVNLWGGDTSAGERGILHEHDLSQRHLDRVAHMSEMTGARLHNLLVGRGGRVLTAAQCDRIGGVSEAVLDRGGSVLIEPSKGASDYPVQTLADAAMITESIPGTELLADLWHLAGEGGTEGAGRVDAWLSEIAASGDLPGHVQLADDPGRGAPGCGVLPLERWVAALRAAGYAGDIAGEWVW